ncbi:hypothetical protein HHI36_018619 [Cryptolaemus montrouzieri]|uniref:BRCT domain-containing protein n=1 Tax=Cryptolaemus montrouzieri TaxID=559131 RepID=A0ABD2P0G7_9CUCU
MDGTTSSSSSKMSSLQISADEKIDGNEPKEIERSGTNISINKVNDVAEKVTTPFVTERKRKNCSKSEASELKKSLISRRESLALKKEQNKFEMDLKLRKEFHDKNKEIELGCNKVKNNGDTKKSLKFDVIASPFVNTRPRRVSSKNVVQEGSNSNSERRKSTMIGTKISRNQLTEKEKEIDEITENMPLNPELLRTEKTAKNGDLKVFPGKEKLNEQTSRTRTSNKVSDKTYEIKTPVVLLENILISPQKNSVDTNQSIRKSRRKTLLESDKGTAVSSISTLKENEELSTGNSDEKTECAKFEPKESSKKVTKSISDKTIDTIRRSRRIRKLYNPEDAVINPDIQQEISVDDDEEREKIRKEKVMKINSVAEGVFLSGNVLLTQKALEYLEKNRNNQNVISTLYKSPESLLDDLGIERKKKIEKKKESFMDISGIEPIKLGEEFVHKKPKGPSQSQSGGFKTPTTRKSTRILTSKFATTEKKRRSTLEFEPNSLRVPKIKTMLKLDQKPTIVCTKMHKPDVQMFNQIVKKLGAFEVEDEVSSRTTHLVVGEVKRTINMLRALARGCWILKQEWLLSSLEQRKWLSEEDYEVTEFSSAVQKCRLERSAFGPSYTMNIFLNCGLIYVAKSTTPRCSDLRELIGLCKGKLTKIPDNAAIAVGSYFEDCKCVTEHWILDSISAGKLKPMKKYLISNAIKSPFV